MGIPMDDNIHAPTVSSGPTTGGRSDERSSGKLSLIELMAEKDRVEGELKALGSVLESVSSYAHRLMLFYFLALLLSLYIEDWPANHPVSPAWCEYEHELDYIRRIPSRRHRRRTK